MVNKYMNKFIFLPKNKMVQLITHVAIVLHKHVEKSLKP